MKDCYVCSDKVDFQRETKLCRESQPSNFTLGIEEEKEQEGERDKERMRWARTEKGEG